MLQVRTHHFGSSFPPKRVDSGQGIVVHASHGVDVSALIEGRSFELLGRHEVNGSEDGVSMIDGLEGGFRGKFGETEVDQLHLEFSAWEPGHHHVGGLEVAVNDVEILRGNERLLGLNRNFAKVLQGEGSAFDHFIESAPGKQFHHNIGASFVHPCVVDRDDVGVLHGGERFGLLQEVFDGFILILEAAFRDYPLDGDIPIEAAIKGPIDGSDAPLSDLPLNFISVAVHGKVCAAGGDPYHALVRRNIEI